MWEIAVVAFGLEVMWDGSANASETGGRSSSNEDCISIWVSSEFVAHVEPAQGSSARALAVQQSNPKQANRPKTRSDG